MLSSLRIIFTLLVLSLFGCEHQQRIDHCMTFCSMTACRPNAGSVEPLQVEECNKCRADCSHA